MLARVAFGVLVLVPVVAVGSGLTRTPPRVPRVVKVFVAPPDGIRPALPDVVVPVVPDPKPPHPVPHPKDPPVVTVTPPPTHEETTPPTIPKEKEGPRTVPLTDPRDPVLTTGLPTATTAPAPAK